jgi:hypothetical protein
VTPAPPASPAPGPLRRALRRILSVALWPFVAIYMLMSGILWPAIRPIVADLGRLPAMQRLHAWLERQGPVTALLLFVIPFAILEPLKALAVYWAARGHVLSGMGGLLALHGATLLSTERLFAVLKPTLLTLAWFALLWGRIETTRARLLVWLRGTAAWRELARLGAAIKGLARRVLAWLHREARGN